LRWGVFSTESNSPRTASSSEEAVFAWPAEQKGEENPYFMRRKEEKIKFSGLNKFLQIL
jgi:hypothetical protein